MEEITRIVAWMTLINLVLLVSWLLMFIIAHDWIYILHRRWFTISVERFDAIHYSGMALFKSLFTLFNLAPYIALRIVA